MGERAAGGTAIEVAAIYGAATPPGRLAAALDAAAGELVQVHGARVVRVDLHELRLEPAGTRELGALDAPTREAVAALEHADAVLVASPVYRASFPGVLKNLLDLTPVEALRGKPVGILVVGATAHHYLGVDRHLRDVLAWFGALPLPVSVYLTGDDFRDGIGERASAELRELAAALVGLARSTRGGDLGPPPLAARYG